VLASHPSENRSLLLSGIFVDKIWSHSTGSSSARAQRTEPSVPSPNRIT
jgi:hypothetical protein